MEVDDDKRLDFVTELERMKFLNKGQYFIEAIRACRTRNKIKEVKIKWVGYPNCTWEPFSVLNKELKLAIQSKTENDLPSVLTVNEI